MQLTISHDDLLPHNLNADADADADAYADADSDADKTLASAQHAVRLTGQTTHTTQNLIDPILE